MGKPEYFDEDAFMTAFDSVMLASELAAGNVTPQDLKNQIGEG